MSENIRTRTITWHNPLESAQQGRLLSGLEYLRALQRGELPPPPIIALMDFKLDVVEEGRVVFSVEPAEFHYNPIGVVHGGLAATLLDSAMGCAVLSQLPVGTSFTTLELKINYLRALTSDTGLVIGEGKIIHMGGRIATTESRLVDPNGKLYAHATSTCMVLRP